MPGTQHLYNNWDFNAAGAIFEQLTKRAIHDTLDTDLAQPLGMQDFDRARQRKTGNLQRSSYPAYHMWLSSRDMARLGLLMLHDGRWRNKQVMPPGWSARITRLVTTRDEWIPDRRRRLGDERWGYGYMWWVWDAPKDSGAMAGVYTARDIMDGAYTARRLGGQFITVLPQFDMVIAHKTDSRYGGDASNRRKRVSAQEYATAVRMVIAARCDVSGCR